jgi:hypothetical protein
MTTNKTETKSKNNKVKPTLTPSIDVDMVHQTIRKSTTRMSNNGESVGLAEGSGGRSCESHEKFLDHLAVDDLVKFKVCVMEVRQKEDTVINAVKIRDGVESCHVGFLSRHIVYVQRFESLQTSIVISWRFIKTLKTLQRRERIAVFVALHPFIS